jgi:hypothetical protein
MPRRPDNARVEILIPLTSTLLRPGTGVYNHSRDLHTGMTWAECRQLPMTNTDWWWLLQRRAIRFMYCPTAASCNARSKFGNHVSHALAHRSVRCALSLTNRSRLEFTFGIEIECVLPRTMSHRLLAQTLAEAGIAAHVEGYNHHTSHDWKITTDGSIRCHGGRYTYGTELVSPILRGIDGMNQAIKVCKLLVENRVKVNKSCGLHVHVGARNRPVEWFRSVLKIYSEHETSIDSMLAPSRRGSSNGYCNTIRLNQMVNDATTLDELRAAYNHNTNHNYYPLSQGESGSVLASWHNRVPATPGHDQARQGGALGPFRSGNLRACKTNLRALGD